MFSGLDIFFIRDTIGPVFLFAYNAKCSLWKTFELGPGYFFNLPALPIKIKWSPPQDALLYTKIIRLLIQPQTGSAQAVVVCAMLVLGCF